MIKDFRNPDEFDYEYFKRLEASKPSTPIRVVYHKGSRTVIGVDTIDTETGSLVRGYGITRYDTDPFVEDSSKEEFDRLCEEIMQKKTEPEPDVKLG